MPVGVAGPRARLTGHTDLVFGAHWVTPDTVLAGGRDGRVSVWTVPATATSSASDDCVDEFSPAATVRGLPRAIAPQCQQAAAHDGARVRGVAVNAPLRQAATLSGNGAVRVWDVERLVPIWAPTVPYAEECIPLAFHSVRWRFALFFLGP